MGPRALPLDTDLLSVSLVSDEFAAGSPPLSQGCAIRGNTSSLTVQLEKRFVLPANRSVGAEG